MLQNALYGSLIAVKVYCPAVVCREAQGLAVQGALAMKRPAFFGAARNSVQNFAISLYYKNMGQPGKRFLGWF